MELFILSFVSGVLTVLAPCVLPLLPVIIGGSVGARTKIKPFLITGGLALSIVIFTLLLKASTLLIDIDPSTWKLVSGGIVLLFGIVYLFPEIWDKISIKLNLSTNSDKLLDSAQSQKGWIGDILLGGALGPVFASCSPTYSLIVATVLPVNFIEGTFYVLTYAIGLAFVMLAIALLGKRLTKRLKSFSDPNGWFKQSLGVIFVLVGLAVISGFDKFVETRLLEGGYFDITRLEQFLLDKFMK